VERHVGGHGKRPRPVDSYRYLKRRLVQSWAAIEHPLGYLLGLPGDGEGQTAVLRGRASERPVTAD
jgi:hypothetical protein